MKDAYLYSATFLQGLQVIDLGQAITEYQQAIAAGDQFGEAVSTAGEGFATDAIINTISLPLAGGGMATMFGLQANDFATSNSGSAAATQTLLAATGQLPLVVADPALSGLSAVLYPPASSGVLSQPPLQMTSADGKTTYQLQQGRAVALATIPVTDGAGNTTNRHIAVVVGAGTVTTAGTPVPGVSLLAVVDLTGVYTPGATVTCAAPAATGSPNCPQLVGFLQLSAGATDVVINGTVALVATGTNILLVNLENPAQPVAAGQITGSFGNWLALTDGGYVVATSPNSTASGVQTAAFQAVVATQCPSPLPAALLSGTPFQQAGTSSQSPVYQTAEPISCTIRVIPPSTPATSANFTLTRADGTVVAAAPNVPLTNGVGVAQLPVNLSVTGNAAFAKSTATNTQSGQLIQPLTQTVTVGTIALAVDSDNDTTISPQMDSQAAQNGKKFSFWQKDANNTGNGGQDSLLDYAPIRVYAGALPDPSVGKIELVLKSANYTAQFLVTKNTGVQDGATDATAAANEDKYLTDQTAAQSEMTNTNTTATLCGAATGLSFETSLCQSALASDNVSQAVELNNMQNGQMYDILLSVSNIDCTPSGSAICGPNNGSGTLEVVLLKNDNTTVVLDQVPVDLRPLQNWMTVETVRNQSTDTPLPIPQLHSGWEDIPAAAQTLVTLVHGYYVTDQDATLGSPGEPGIFPTYFKRLYWAGHPVLLAQNNTHTVGFSWPGDVSTANYPDDEFTALEAGVPLALFLTQQASSGRKIQILAHSLGNMVVNSAINRLVALGGTQTLGAITSFVMNEAAIPAEAFDQIYDPGNISSTLQFHASHFEGFPSDSLWQSQWKDMQTDPLSSLLLDQWNNTLSASSYLTRPAPQYQLRWTQQRPAAGVPDSDPGATPQRGPWLGFFAANPRQVTITNTFSTNDQTLKVTWRLAENTEKPDIPGPDDEIAQYWASLANTEGTQENLWGDPICYSANACRHSNIIRQWAELAYWFPSVSNAVGSQGVNSLTSLDFTPYDPGIGLEATHSYLRLAQYPEVSPAWQHVAGMLQ